jgi:hypothetical protein
MVLHDERLDELWVYITKRKPRPETATVSGG